MTCNRRRSARAPVSFALVVPFLLAPSPPLAAQEQPTQEKTEDEKTVAETLAPAEGETLVRLTEVVSVTGTLIPRKDLESLSPVAIVNPEEVTYQGTARIEDLLQAQPQVFASQNSTIANGPSGTATVGLRWLGSLRTLVLLDGRRMASGDAWETAPDLNFVPAALVKRVDVLTGGASSVYGADAVAGVVNVVLDTEFEGVRGGIRYNGFQHDNRNVTARAMNEAVGFPVPTGSIWDGGSLNADIAVGGKFAGGKGHASAYIDYRDIAAILKERRDYTNCSVSRGKDGPVCSGSTATPQGRFISFDPDWNLVGDHVLDLATGDRFRPRTSADVYNYGPYNHMQRPDTKWSGGAFARYTVDPHLEPYAEVMFMDDYTDAQIAPSGNFGSTGVINCDNPMLSPQQRDLLCTQAGFGPDDYANVITQRRNSEGGPRVRQIRHTSFRLLGGLRGDLAPGWSYDVYGLEAEVSSPQSFINDFHSDRIGQAMDVVGEANDPGTWRCRSDAAVAAGCQPWNIFRAGGVTQGALDYLQTGAVLDSGTRTQMVNLTVRADLERHGVTFPSASEGIQLALGAEYRKESLYVNPDEVYRQGLRAGSTAATPAIDGGFNVGELFAEARVPVVQDVRGVEDLSLELGYRYAHYNLSGGNSSYKALLSWAPIGGLRLRGGINRAVRAPNVQELFAPQEMVVGDGDLCENDPVTGVPSATLEQCLRTGLSAAQYGRLPANPLGWINFIRGGNPNLKVEFATTLTAGFVWTPKAITGLSATIDYYDIQLEDTIGSLGAIEIIRMCANSGDPVLCGLIHRDSAGTLWFVGDGYVDGRNQNIGQLPSRGLDVSASYPLNLGSRGFVNLSLVGSYLLESGFKNRVTEYDCAGYYGNQCWQPNARWRQRVRASWQTPFDTTISLGWRFISSVLIDDASPDEDLADPGLVESWKINGAYRNPAYSFFDLAGTYSFRDGLRLTLGVNNILDKEPPLAPGLGANDYGPGFYGLYDPLGRTVYASLQFDF